MRGLTAGCFALLVGCSGEDEGAKAPLRDTTLRVYTADDPNIQFTGRFDFSVSSQARTSGAAAYAMVRFEGISAAVHIEDQFLYGRKNHYAAVVDGGEPVEIEPDNQRSSQVYSVANDLPYGEHTLRIYKKTESGIGFGRFMSFQLEGTMLEPAPRPERRIEIIGDSISAGAGNEVKDGHMLCGDAYWGQANDASRSYGALLAEKLDAEFHINAVSGRGLVRNYTMTKNDPRPIPEVYDSLFLEQPSSPKWDPSAFVPHAVLVALGTNDFSPGDPSEGPREQMTVQVFTEAYVAFVERLRGYYPDAHVFLLSSPMLGDHYPDESYESASDQRESLTRVEAEFASRSDFKVTKVFVEKRSGAGCGTHPDRAQHAKMAEELEPVLRDALGW